MKILSIFYRSSAFNEALERIRPKLYRMAFSWCHNGELAEDLVQEAITKALKNASQLRDPELMSSWLFSILANCWRDHFRQSREMDDIDDLDDLRCATNITPEDMHAESQLVTRVRDAVAQLPVGQRQVLTLVDLEEFSYVEVAAILSIPVGTVMSRLCRARKALKVHLEEVSPVVCLRRVK